MFKIVLNILILIGFIFASTIGPICPIACSTEGEFRLPAPGVMVSSSPSFEPPILKGIKIHPQNPFRFDFILDFGDKSLSPGGGNVETPLMASLQNESIKLIKYFLASLTIPENDLWVNLSPYEKNRIIPRSFGLTEMGRDLLAEDYMLKQITASLIYPEDGIGKKFWKRVYAEAERKFGTTNIPVNTFNKVWIIPEKAVVYENSKADTVYVVESKLKVMLEQDYLSLEKHKDIQSKQIRRDAINGVSTSQIVREIVVPELTREVNEDKNFARLRQIYNSLILATWYKKKIKDSILVQVYADKNKVAGVQYDKSVILPAPLFRGLRRGPGSATKDLNRINSLRDSSPSAQNDTEQIYQRYLRAFKKGVFNYIKEDASLMPDAAGKEERTLPKKYFSGGVKLGLALENSAMRTNLKGVTELNTVHVLPENIQRSKSALFDVEENMSVAGFQRDSAMSEKASSRLINNTIFPDVSREDRLLGRSERKWPEAISVLGSARIPEGHPYYDLAVRLGRAIYNAHESIRTGAAFGIMGATSQGYAEARRLDGYSNAGPKFRIQGDSILIPHENTLNSYVELVNKYTQFITRIRALHENMKGGIFLPGGYGSLEELFELWHRNRRMVLMAKDFWLPIIKAFEKGWQDTGIVEHLSHKDGLDLFYTDDPEQAVSYAKQGVPYKTSPAQFQKINQELKRSLGWVYSAPRSVVLFGKQYENGPDVDLIRKISNEVVKRFNVPVRVTRRWKLFDAVSETAKKEGWLDKLYVVFYSGDPLQKPPKNGQKTNNNHHLEILDQSVHQFVSGSNAYAYVFLPGGVGTMNRLFEILTNMQTNKLAHKPVLLVGRRFWKPIMDTIFKTMLERPDGLKLISEEDRNLFKIVDEDNLEESLNDIGRSIEEFDRSDARFLGTHETSQAPVVNQAMVSFKPGGDQVYEVLYSIVHEAIKQFRVPYAKLPVDQLPFLTEEERRLLNNLLENLSIYLKDSNGINFKIVKDSAIRFDRVLRLYGYGINFFKKSEYDMGDLGKHKVLEPVLGPIIKKSLHTSSNGKSYMVDHIRNMIERRGVFSMFNNEVEGAVTTEVEINPTVYRFNNVISMMKAKSEQTFELIAKGEKIDGPLERLALLGLSAIDFQDEETLDDVYAEVVEAHEARHYLNRLDGVLTRPVRFGPFNKYRNYFYPGTVEFLLDYYKYQGPKSQEDQVNFEYAVSEEITSFLAELALGPLPIYSLSDMIKLAKNSSRDSIEEHRLACLDILNSFFAFLYKKTKDIRFDEDIWGFHAEQYDEMTDLILAYIERGKVTEQDLATFAEEEFQKRFGSSLYVGDYKKFENKIPVRAARRFSVSTLSNALNNISPISVPQSMVTVVNDLVRRFRALENKNLISYLPLDKQELKKGDILKFAGIKCIIDEVKQDGQVFFYQIPDNQIKNPGNYFKAVNRKDIIGAQIASFDHAMEIPKPRPTNGYGGIDLTSLNRNLKAQDNGKEMKLHIDSTMLKQLQMASGFVPVIINIRPITNLKSFLG